MSLLQQFSQQQPAQDGGSLLAQFGGSQQAPQQTGVSPQGVQMAKALAANPTPQMVQQIIQQLHQSGSPEAAQYEQILSGLGSDPQQIQQFANAFLQKAGG